MTNKDDPISREAALACFHDWIDKNGDLHTPDEMAEYRAIEGLPSAQPEITLESAIDYLHSVGWMQNHDKQMYEDGQRHAQPEPIWGLHASVDRPLGDLEIVPRLREIQKQIGGSYAIDRAIEIIEAVAERRTDEPD